MKKYKMQQQKKIVYIIIAVILLGILSAVCGYINYIKTSGFNVAPDMPSATEAADYTEPPTASVSTAAPSRSSLSYTKVVAGGIEFEYPSFFEAESSNEHILSLRYTADNAVLILDREQTDNSIKDIMNKFSSKISGDVLTSASGNDWYSISKKGSNKIYHSCGRIVNDRLIKYDMVFDAELEEKYFYSLEYMDKFIKGE